MQAALWGARAARRGARVTGIDATAALIAIARERIPHGDFRVGEMEALPYAHSAFDVVTGFNSFQYAASPVNALREAGRVARTGAPVVIAVWGKPEDTEAAAYLAALGSLMPPPPPGAPGPFALSQDGALEALVTQAELTPTQVEEVDCLWEYPDEETALRGLLAAGPAVLAIQRSGEDRVREATARAIAPFRTASGGYELKNKFRYLIARA
jgi:SAM-dependent methyltransferase